MRMVLQTVKRGVGVDFDPVFIEWATKVAKKEELPAEVILHDVIASPRREIPAAYSLDVIEHIEARPRMEFVANIARRSSRRHCFMGTPNIIVGAICIGTQPARSHQFEIRER